MPMRLIVASANRGKLAELAALLSGLAFELVAQPDLGIGSVEESGTTFLANALLKARHAALHSGTAALADDSGLEVDALGGAPGIFSARYAGQQADDRANNSKLVGALQGIPAAQRDARYRCVLALVRSADDPAPLIAQGRWEGQIVDAPRGARGFGYDPHFWLPDQQMTAAELDPAVKNHLSHRGQALRQLRSQIEAWA